MVFFRCIVILSLLMPCHIWAQKLSSLDSLEFVFENTNDTLNRIDAGRRLWYTNLRFYNFTLYNNKKYMDRVDYYENKLIPLELMYENTPTKFNKEIDQLLYKMEHYQFKQDYDSLIIVGAEAVNKIKVLNEGFIDIEQIEMLINILIYKAEVISYNNDLIQAIKTLLDALETAKKHNLKTSEIKVNYVIAKLLINNFSDNEYAYEKALDLLEPLKDQIALVNSTKIFDKTFYEDRIRYYSEDYKYNRGKNLLLAIDSYYIYLFGEELFSVISRKIDAYNTVNSNNYVRKIEYLEENANVLEDHHFKNTYLYVQIEFLLGIYHFKLNNLEKAFNYLYEVNTLLEKQNYINTNLFDYKLLYSTLEQISKIRNDYKNAYIFATKTSKFNLKKRDNSFMSVTTLLKTYETNQINLLQQDLSKQRFKKLIAYSFLLICTIIIVFFVFSYRSKLISNKILAKKNKELEHTMQEKAKLEYKIENIQSDMAKDLHDNFGSRITSILTTQSILRDINKDGGILDNENLSRFSYLLEDGLSRLTNDIKDLIWINNKENNSLRKVIDRIQFYVDDEAEHKTTSSIKLLVDLEKKDYNLPKFWNRQILLIVKEAINNAIKHAQANQIKLLVIVTAKNELQIICEDNGIGFNTEKLKRISGIKNMKTRAASIDCKINFTSEKYKGTKIELSGRIPSL
ncbi:MAG: sensor histidine kinase [Aestuariibaculum sp.]